MFHRITLIGRVGQDPEMRYTPEGVAVANFSVATTTQVKKQTDTGERPCPQGWKESYNGKYWEVTTWWRVSCWRGLADTVVQYLQKGRQVYVEGEVRGVAEDGVLNPRVWFTTDGTARASFEITARTVKFLGSSSNSSITREEEPPQDFF